MKTFRCSCGNTLHFENTQCLACGRTVGFLADQMTMAPLEQVEDGRWQILPSRAPYRPCANLTEFAVCNWWIADEGSNTETYCQSCRLNQIIPNLSEERNLILWFRMEQAKRRLVYTLYTLGLRVKSKAESSTAGLGFRFLQDEVPAEGFDHELTVQSVVTTGHSHGIITMNVSEAEPSAREEMREQMNERYRTLLGHFRHESGHYFWDRLIRDSEFLDRFRELFGDERLNYSASLAQHYANGPPDHWEECWISAYASSHAWEDWAETWAHYLHIVDTLETAHDFGFHVEGNRIQDPRPDDFVPFRGPGSFTTLMNDWSRMSTALNALNRSMGMEDAYPFVISGPSRDKLRFIHRVIKSEASG